MKPEKINSIGYITKWILVLWLCWGLPGCRPECMTKALGELNCNAGYISVKDVKYHDDYIFWKYARNELIIINDTASYSNAFGYQNYAMPFGYIDFNTKSLVGVKIYRPAGSGIESQGCLCYNPSSKKWLFKIEYTVSDQCKGSGISSGEILCAVICPKLPAGAEVQLSVKDINEF